MAEREGKNVPAKPRAGAASAFDGLSEELLVLILERCKDGALAAGPSNGEPATLPCHHFRLVCKEWAALGLKVLTKVRVRDDWAQLSAPHLERLLQRCPHIKKVDISFGYGQEPWVETDGSDDAGLNNPDRVLHMRYTGWPKPDSDSEASPDSEEVDIGVVAAKELAKENLLQILEKHEWSHVWTRQCACVYTTRLCALGNVAFLSVVPGMRVWMDFPSGTVLQWLRLNSFLTTLIVDLREDLDSFQSWLGFRPHVEPHVGSFPALQNLHLPLGDAPYSSIFSYRGVVVNLPTLFPCLKSFRMDEWVESFWTMEWDGWEGMSASGDDRDEPLIWPGLESLTLGNIEAAGEVRARWIPGSTDYAPSRGRGMLWAIDPDGEGGIDVVHALTKLQLPDLRRLSLIGVMLRHSELGWVPNVLKLFPSLEVMEGEVLNSRKPRENEEIDGSSFEEQEAEYERRLSVDNPNMQELQEDRISFQGLRAALEDTWWLTVDEVWPGKVRPDTFHFKLLKRSCTLDAL